MFGEGGTGRLKIEVSYQDSNFFESMKPVKVIVSLLFIVPISFAECGEVVVTGNRAIKEMNIWLRQPDGNNATGTLPLNHVEGEGTKENPYIWRNVKRGKYVICLDPDFEDWASHCVAATSVDVGEGVSSVHLEVPDGKLKLTVNLDDSTKVKQNYGDSLVFRVEKIREDGKSDPLIRYWLWTDKSKNGYLGELEYLSPGNYKFVAFEINKDAMPKDIASGQLEITEALLKEGNAEIHMKRVRK